MPSEQPYCRWCQQRHPSDWVCDKPRLEFECEFTASSVPICPWCAHKQDLSDGIFWTEDEVEIDCESCDKPIMVFGHVKWSFTSVRDEE